MSAEEVIRKNVAVLASRETRDVALSESVSGNAGVACYALNMFVTSEGLITGVGNVPDRINATLRVYVPSFSARVTKLSEIAIDLQGDLTPEARDRVTRATWLWNLHREKSESAIIERFMKGKVAYAAVVEILRSKYPELVKAL